MSNHLLIRLTKGNGKPDTLTCRRPDGSVTWARCPGPAQHDLVHYAVESVLGLTSSFFSLIAEGHDLRDFEVPGAAKALQLPAEASQTEFVVGLFQTELASGVPFDDFSGELRNACVAKGVAPPEFIRPNDVSRIRSAIHRLLERWAHTEPGGHIELTFPIPDGSIS